MSSFFKKVASVALPIAGTVLAPGIGTALGSALSAGTLAAAGGALGGAAGGALGGGGLKSALTGAALGGVAGAAPSIAGALGTSGAQAAGLTNALRGGALGGIAGGSQGALLGAGLGGLGGYVSAGGTVPGLGNVAGASLDQVSGIEGLQGPTQGSGLLGSLTKGTGIAAGGGGSIIGGGLSSGGDMNLGSVLRGAAGINSLLGQGDTNEEIQRALLNAQRSAQAQLSPFQQTGVQANQQLSQALSGGFDPSGIESNPAYQFRLQQGEQALGRRLASSGLSQSGAALRAAQEFGQGLAATEYDNAYNRWLQQNQQLAGLSGQGLGAAGAIGQGLTDIGGAQAVLASADQQAQDRALSELLSGNLTRSIFG